MTQDVNEPIDVLSIFRDGAMRPVKFKWSQRTLLIRRVSYRWVTREGAYPVHHFAVMVDGHDSYHITFDTYTMHWVLESVDTEG